MKWVILHCLPFLVPFCFLTLQYLLTISQIILHSLLSLSVIRSLRRLLLFTIFRIVLHSFLSLSIICSLYCSLSFKFRLRLCLRVNDLNRHYRRLFYESILNNAEDNKLEVKWNAGRSRRSLGRENQ